MAHIKGTPKTGGRQKGSKNKSTVALRAAVEAQLKATEGITPMDYYTAILNKPAPERLQDEELGQEPVTEWLERRAQWEKARDHAAHELLPYTAARLSAITGDDGASVDQIAAVNERTQQAQKDL